MVSKWTRRPVVCFKCHQHSDVSQALWEDSRRPRQHPIAKSSKQMPPRRSPNSASGHPPALGMSCLLYVITLQQLPSSLIFSFNNFSNAKGSKSAAYEAEAFTQTLSLFDKRQRDVLFSVQHNKRYSLFAGVLYLPRLEITVPTRLNKASQEDTGGFLPSTPM